MMTRGYGMRLRTVFALMLFVSLCGVVATPLALLHAEESIQGKPAYSLDMLLPVIELRNRDQKKGMQ